MINITLTDKSTFVINNYDEITHFTYLKRNHRSLFLRVGPNILHELCEMRCLHFYKVMVEIHPTCLVTVVSMPAFFLSQFIQ